MKKRVLIIIVISVVFAVVLIRLLDNSSPMMNNEKTNYENTIIKNNVGSIPEQNYDIQIDTIEKEHNTDILQESLVLPKNNDVLVTNSNNTIETKAQETNETNKNNNTEVTKENSNNIQEPAISQEKTEEKKNTTINNETEKIDTKENIEENEKKDEENIKTKEDFSHPELAYKTYRATNNDILPEIISLLTGEISKDRELVNFGCKVVSTSKENAYNNTEGFTYLFVKDITKGKVTGNYQKFTERVRNTVGSFGTYYVYAEDEYTYDGQGLNPKWSQTLVWIYVRF